MIHLTIAITLVGAIFIVWFVLVVLFAPGIPYHVETTVDASSEHFIGVLESSCQGALRKGNRIEVFTNGTAFYPAMIEAIREAREIVKFLKDQKLKKVQASIQGDQVRVTSPSKDDLQDAMRHLRGHDFGVALHFGNYR